VPSIDLALLVVAGVAFGAVNAVAGGGSLLLFPALLAAGFPPLAANVTNSVIQCPGYLGVALGSRRQLRGQQSRVLATTGEDLRRLNAVKGVLSLIIGLVTVVVSTIGAPVNWLVVVLLAPTTLVGGFLGAKLAVRLSAPVLRGAVVLVGLAVSIYLFMR